MFDVEIALSKMPKLAIRIEQLELQISFSPTPPAKALGSPLASFPL